VVAITKCLFTTKILFEKNTASALVILIEMERKSSLPEKIAKDVEEVTSRLLLKKSRDPVQFSLNCLIKKTV
jgi:hypothetical protein